MDTKELDNIISGCKKGDRKSQGQLYKLFAGKMFAVCMYYAGNKTEAEDFLHNGFIKVFQNIKQYQSIGSFEGWMRKIFMHTALEKFRKEKHLFFTEADSSLANYSSETEDVFSRLSALDLIQLIQQLSPAYRLAFNLYAIEGYSHKEIASLLGISESTSKSNLSRARILLQQKVTSVSKEKTALR